MGHVFHRIKAVDGSQLDRSFNEIRSNLSNSEIACISSHIKALKAFLDSESQVCCILEDDIILSDEFHELMSKRFHFPEDGYIIKLETFSQIVEVSRSFKSLSYLKMNELRSMHYGSAGYLTTRNGAQRIIKELSEYDLPVDHVIFEKMLLSGNHGLAYQLNPACCIQEFVDTQSQDSDIRGDILSKRKNDKVRSNFKIKLKKELNRVFKNIKRIVYICNSILFKRSMFKKIGIKIKC